MLQAERRPRRQQVLPLVHGLNRLTIRQVPTGNLSEPEISELRQLLFAAFEEDEHGGFSEDDWQHARGGMHFVGDSDGLVVAHAAVVERELRVGGRPVRTAYVEAVATLPDRQQRGFGTSLMRDVNAYIRAGFELGALGTGSHGFYERIGWRVWKGPSYVRTVAGDVRTADEDGYIMVLMTPTTPVIKLDSPISCEWRPGDVW